MRYAWAGPAWVSFGNYLHGSCNLGGWVQHGLLSAITCMVHANLASTLLWMCESFRLAPFVMMKSSVFFSVMMIILLLWWWKGLSSLGSLGLVGSPIKKLQIFFLLCLLLWFVSAPGWSSGGNIAASWFVVPSLACLFRQMVASPLLSSVWSALFGFVLHQRFCVVSPSVSW